MNIREYDWREAGDEDLHYARESALAEMQRRETLQQAQEQAEALADQYAQAVEGDPAREYKPGLVTGPGQRVIENGVEYVNTSGAFLPVSPSQYPLGFQRVETPVDVAPFVTGESVKAGDLREFEGKVYQCLQAHTTAAHWAPGLAPSLWTLA